VERLRELLEESVRLHMVSDVPLGHSSAVESIRGAVAATAAGMSLEPLKTFSIGFDEPRYDERAHARRVANCFCTDHSELTLGPGALDELEDLAWHLDEPFGDCSAIPTYMVSKLAAERVKVVLSGDGGDELFAGYDRYVVEQRERGQAPLPAALRRVMGAAGRAMPDGMRGRNRLRHHSLTGAQRYLDSVTLFRHDDLERLLQPDAFAMLAGHDPWRSSARHLESGDGHWLSKLQALDIESYLPLDILTKVDRMSMAHSIEPASRCSITSWWNLPRPFPAQMNLRNGTTKYILKQAMRGILPDAIIDRRKQGFAVAVRFLVPRQGQRVDAKSATRREQQEARDFQPAISGTFDSATRERARS
jgi:asparagine synthase (glutamine-hydrolysing)